MGTGKILVRIPGPLSIKLKLIVEVTHPKESGVSGEPGVRGPTPKLGKPLLEAWGVTT